MPPPPELGDAFGDIGVVEVGQELKAQHPPQAHGHVGVAGEIEINLEGEGQHPQPGPGHRQLRQGHGLVAVPQGPHVVGNEQLLSKAHHEDLHPGGKFVRRAGPLVDLIPQVLVLDDGSGDELGEEGDKGAEVEDVPLGTGISPVDVDGVAHGLEGVEGDTDGQMEGDRVQKGQTDILDDGHELQPGGGKAAGDEIPIFEEAQQSQIENDGGGHRHPRAPVVPPGFAPLHQQAVGKVDGGGQEHDDDINLLAPVVEYQGSGEQNHVAPLPGDDIVQKQSENQEIELENGGGKDHGGPPHTNGGRSFVRRLA